MMMTVNIIVNFNPPMSSGIFTMLEVAEKMFAYNGESGLDVDGKM